MAYFSQTLNLIHIIFLQKHSLETNLHLKICFFTSSGSLLRRPAPETLKINREKRHIANFLYLLRLFLRRNGFGLIN